MLAFWHSFVEPFFGRGQRQYTPLHTKMEMQQLEAEEHVEKQSSSSEEPEEPKGEPGCWCAGAVLCLWGCVGAATLRSFRIIGHSPDGMPSFTD